MADVFLGIGTVAFVILAIYIPPSQWPILAGRFLKHDWLHHWTFFAMGPAQGYSHGKSLAAQTYSQYGVGWPMSAVLLSKFVPLGYGHLIGIAVTYACIYYIGVFILLRCWLRHSLWAAIGTMLAVHWQMFNGIGAVEIKWLAPSSTMLRHPMDVWFFLSLLCSARARTPAGRTKWLASAGLCCGVGFLFELDTGILLLGAAVALFILTAMLDRPADGAIKKQRLLGALAFGAALVVGWLPGMLVAGRGHLSGTFWRGWIEGLGVQGFTGFGMIALSGVDDSGLILFCAIVLVYLLTVAHSIIACLHRDASSPPVGELLLPACVSLYGLGLQLNFVGRSHPNNIYHAMVPFALVSAYWIWRSRRMLDGVVRATSIPAVFAAGLLVVVCTSPEMHIYPNVARRAWLPSPAAYQPLDPERRDIVFPSENPEPFQLALQALIPRLKALAAGNKPILILDEHDTVLYSETGIEPWHRYSSLLYMCQSWDTIAKVRREIIHRKPEYIVLRGHRVDSVADAKEGEFADVLEQLSPTIRKNYEPMESVGTYEIWRHVQAATDAFEHQKSQI